MYCTLHASLLAAAMILQSARGDYSYSYTTRAPSVAPTSSMAPTATMAPSRADTYAPTRMTDAPSYAPTTETYAPTYESTRLDDTTIRFAVRAWFDDHAAAEAKYGHISTWATGGVTDMSGLLCGASWVGSCNSAAASFNEDISAWNTSGVMSMRKMFYGASAFNQDIGNWTVDSGTNMGGMFWYASAFNHDIGGWAVDKVTNMATMFYGASVFNQDIGGWAVDRVTDMSKMFSFASAFNQSLGWCVNDDVDLDSAFDATSCESTSCGITYPCSP